MEVTSPLPPRWRRWELDRHPSSNAAALEAARNGDPGRLWVTTVEQTAGRGRRGREWVSSRGNLHASLLLIDPAPADLTPTISYVAGVALDAALSEAAGPAAGGAIRLKWPNDLLCTGRKVAGILVEGADLGGGRRAVVIGFGVNCVAHPGLGEGYVSGDLASLGVPVEAEPLFLRLAAQMAAWLERWDAGRGFATIRAQWMDRSVGLGLPVKARLPDRLVEGRFDDLDATGRLVLTRLDGQREAISAGDVFFGPRGI